MFLRVALLAICSFLATVSFAQDITGTWSGNYEKKFLTPTPQKLIVEIFIYNDSVITGATHLYYKNSKYEHYKINGIFRSKDSTVFFSEDSTISVKLGFMASNCLGNYTMKLLSTDTLMRLTGRWKDNSRAFLHCPSSGVWLEKRLNKITPSQPERKESLPIEDNRLKRNVNIQSLIEINESEKDSIKVEIYDNGVVDNDSVSVYHDNTLLVNKQIISLKPITFYISLNKENPLSKIKMVAESMGTIPPCTALMIITTRKKRYEATLSSNFTSNGSIEFFLKE